MTGTRRVRWGLVAIAILAILMGVFWLFRSRVEVTPSEKSVEPQVVETAPFPSIRPTESQPQEETIQTESMTLTSLLEGFKPDEEVEKGPCVIFGTVSDGNGEPVANALVDVCLMISEEEQFVPLKELKFHFTHSDSEGRYKVGDLPKGVYGVRGLFGAKVALENVWVVGSWIREEVDLELDEGLPISGWVVGAEGASIPDALVFSTEISAETRQVPGWYTPPVKAGTEGYFTTEPLPKEKAYTLIALMDGHGPSRVEDIKPGATNVVLRLVPAGSVSGRVIWESDGRPVENIKVFALPKSNAAELKDSASTDEEGRYAIEDLGAGSYHIYPDARSVPPVILPFTLARGQHLGEVDIELPDPAAIEGIVYDQETGEPIPGVTVIAFQLVASRRSISDSQGYYSLGILGEGDANVRVSGTKKYLLRPLDQNQRRVTLSSGETKEFNIPLQKAGLIFGHVTDSDGNPVSEARVSVLPNIPSRQFRPIEEQTDRDGRYELVRIPPCEACVVAVEKEGFATTRSDEIRVSLGMEKELDLVLERGLKLAGRVVDPQKKPIEGAKATFNEMTPAYHRSKSATTHSDGRFEVSGIRVGNHSISIRRSGYVSFHGTLTMNPDTPLTGYEFVLEPEGEAFVAGLVLFDDAKPATDIRLSASQKLGKSPLSKQAITDSEGKFRIDGFREGTMITVGVRSRYGDDSQEISPNTDDIEFILERGGTIRGKAVNDSGRPIVFARVRILALYGAAEVSTSHEGEFEFTDQPSGRIVLMAYADGYAPRNSEPFNLTPGGLVEGIVIRLEKAGAIRGVVKSKRTNEPISNVFVTVGKVPPLDDWQRRDNPVLTTTDDKGEFLLRNVEPGEHTVAIGHEGYPPAVSKPVRVWADTVAGPLTIFLSRGGSIEGTISKNSEPLPGISVNLQGGFEGSPSKQTTTDGKGHYELHGLSAGTYLLTGAVILDVRDLHLQQFSATVTVGEEGVVYQDFEVPAGTGAVEGYVLDGQDPVAGVNIHLSSSSPTEGVPQMSHDAHADGDGLYLIDGLPEGRYNLRAFLPSRNSRSLASTRQVEIINGQTVREDFLDLVGTAVIEGTVSQHGVPVPGAEIVVVSMDDSSRSLEVRTDSSGYYRIDRVPAGSYRLMVVDEDQVEAPSEINSVIPLIREITVTTDEILQLDFDSQTEE